MWNGDVKPYSGKGRPGFVNYWLKRLALRKLSGRDPRVWITGCRLVKSSKLYLQPAQLLVCALLLNTMWYHRLLARPKQSSPLLHMCLARNRHCLVLISFIWEITDCALQALDIACASGCLIPPHIPETKEKHQKLWTFVQKLISQRRMQWNGTKPQQRQITTDTFTKYCVNMNASSFVNEAVCEMYCFAGTSLISW